MEPSAPPSAEPSCKADRSTSTLGGGLLLNHCELTSHGHFFHLVQEEDIRDFQLICWNKDTKCLPHFSGLLI